jgi:chromosomal replication initiator protein
MTDRSAQQIWETALGELEIEVNRPNYSTWLSGTVGLSCGGGEFVVGVPNTFVAEFLNQNLRSLIEKVLTGVTHGEVKVRFHVAAATGKPQAKPKTAPLFNPAYTFESFIPGHCNSMARAAAVKVAEAPGQAYNPLFLHGPAGVGKTHLLHAIGNEATARGMDVLYVSAEQFTNELVGAIRDGRTAEFRKKFRSVDMLLVDDVQFFGGKEQTKENFFHTFNELHAASRQIAVTCDRPPASIPHIQARLRSRFEWGLVADLLPPDFDTRRAVLEAKAERDGAELTPDVIEFIALQIKENVRALEGSLNRVVAYSRLLKTLATPDLAARALDSIACTEAPPVPPSPALIAEAVAAGFSVNLSDIKSRKRDEETVLARQVSMYQIRQETDCSLAQIGRELGGRSPATISYAYEKIANSINNDPQLRRQVFNIQQKLHATSQMTPQ